MTPALTDATLSRVFIAAVFAEADVLFTPPTAGPAPTYETAKAGSVAEVIARMSVHALQTSGFSATC